MKSAAAVAAVALLVSGCGGSGGKLTVFAASSLTDVFERLEPDARFDFAGSDELAFQIEQGAKVDVYAAASPKYPRQLFSKGVVERPRVFATNRLVLIVPRDSSKVRSVGDLRDRRLRLVVAAAGVPAGDYARFVMRGYCRGTGGCLRARIVSDEPDVKGVVAKVALGEADAGFVYATDARAAAGDVRSIEVPKRLRPRVDYAVAVVEHAPHRDAAEKFVRLVLSPRGRAALSAAGFGPP